MKKWLRLLILGTHITQVGLRACKAPALARVQGGNKKPAAAFAGAGHVRLAVSVG